MSNFYLSIGKLLRVLDCAVPSPGADPDICAGYIEDATLKSEALVAEVKTLRIRNEKLEKVLKATDAVLFFYGGDKLSGAIRNLDDAVAKSLATGDRIRGKKIATIHDDGDILETIISRTRAAITELDK